MLISLTPHLHNLRRIRAFFYSVCHLTDVYVTMAASCTVNLPSYPIHNQTRLADAIQGLTKLTQASRGVHTHTILRKLVSAVVCAVQLSVYGARNTSNVFICKNSPWLPLSPNTPLSSSISTAISLVFIVSYLDIAEISYSSCLTFNVTYSIHAIRRILALCLISVNEISTNYLAILILSFPINSLPFSLAPQFLPRKILQVLGPFYTFSFST